MNMNRKITSHERMEINGRYYVHESGNHRLKADAHLAEHQNHITTGLYLNQEKTFAAGSIWVWCPEREETLHVCVNVMHGEVRIELAGTMQSVKIEDERRPKGGDEE